MKYLLDTNVVIKYLRGRIEDYGKVKSLIKKGCGISAVTLAELYYGAEKSGNRKNNNRKIDVFLRLPVITEIKLDKFIAREYGRLMSLLEAKGKKLEMVDVLIAATAKANKLAVLTGDKKHFQRLRKFGVKIELV